jgi:AraC-like DNA-binding protein
VHPPNARWAAHGGKSNYVTAVTPSPEISTRERVAALLGAQLRIGKVQMAGIANALHMSEATLRRRLSQEGSSFSRLLEEVRFELAKRYLRDPTLEVCDVAQLLGFRDVASFGDSFARWSRGAAPEAFRS